MKKLTRHTLIRLTIVGVILLFTGFIPQPKISEQTQIKLVLQITVDGLEPILLIGINIDLSMEVLIIF